MINKFLLPLAIAVNGVDSRTQEMLDAAAKRKHDIIMWSCIVAAVILITLFAVFVLPKIKAKSAANKEKRAREKAAKEREKELERLHEIKRKNKRK